MQDPRKKKRKKDSPPPPLSPGALQVADQLHSAAIHLLRRLRKQDTASGIGPARLSALSVLVFGGPKSLQQLASAEQVRPPTMSRIVAGLEKQKLIERTPDPGDARRIILRPTARGVELMQKARLRRITDLARHIASLEPDEQDAASSAASLLQRLLHEWK
jgi:DNA-binding MarR family transcriptional regulator